MDESKKIVTGMLAISVFVLIVALSSLYFQTKITEGDICGCMIPIPIFIPFIASLGLFIGMLFYYFFAPRRAHSIEMAVPGHKEKAGGNALLKLFENDERGIMETLIKNGGSCQQSVITKETAMGKVKVHRGINKLLRKGIVEKESDGKTNVITIESGIREALGCRMEKKQ